MRKWVSAVILLAIGAGIYYRYIVFDPLSLVAIILILWTHMTSTAQNRQLAEIIAKSHGVLATNDKELRIQLNVIQSELRKLR